MGFLGGSYLNSCLDRAVRCSARKLILLEASVLAGRADALWTLALLWRGGGTSFLLEQRWLHFDLARLRRGASFRFVLSF
jgi:hypothetical protein